ncbi:MAG: outer membrane protein assembly factor BamD [Chlamydiia bacterium]|nr:outer membrane protein assembly factor BamD [Chlamydiia bacterium]
MQQSRLFTLIFMLAAFAHSLDAAWIVRNGQVMDADHAATMTVEGHWEAGEAAVECEDWKEARNNFRIILSSFPDSSYAQDATFLLGVAYYRLKSLDLAQTYLEQYLDQGGSTYFDLCLRYLLATAETFRNGAKRHLFGSEQLPRWLPGDKQAEQIYDRIISCYPGHEYAAKALIGRGLLHCKRRHFPEAADSFQMLIQRFPRHDLVPEAYVHIGETYLMQAECESGNPDLLILADINLKRFESQFPREERIADLESMIAQMREVYAQGLFDTGQYYERRSCAQAATIYYRNAIQRFPSTAVADSCQERLRDLSPGAGTDDLIKQGAA